MLEGGAEAMSNKIDQRIVEMSFENHKFEKGILESKNSLKEFSNALKNTGTGKSFNGLEDSIGSISRSFSMMEQIGIGALRRIGEMAVNAGTNLVKSLSIDQLTAGLSKYQEKIEAVQTMVSAGYRLEEVEKSMEQLMWFSDETSYSFSDMAGNMAKFIAAGVDLNTAEKAMKGIATWAAHSGKNTQAASIAMFNLSQAIGMGYVDTRNWYSIMNQNMNTKMFKQIAIGVAEATGAIKKGQVTIQNFDTNLKEKWFTNDVLLKTLEQYGEYSEKVKEVQDEMGFDTAMQAMDYMDEHADKYADILDTIGNAAFKAAQESKSFSDSINATKDAVSSGWLKTYEIIFGTLDEAKANFSALTEILLQVFASGGEGRNKLLKDIKKLGGISDIFQTLKNTAIAILKPLQAVSRAFDSIFPPKTAEQWAGMISALKNFTKNLIISDETANKIQRTFRGLFSVLDLGWTTVKFLGSAFLEIIRVIIPFNGSFLELTANIGDFLYVFTQIIKQSGVFEAGLKTLRTSMTFVRDVLGSVISFLFDFVNGLLSAENPIEYIGKAISKMFGGIIQTIKMVSSNVFDGFINSLKKVSGYIESKFGEKNRGIISGFLGILKDFIDFIINKATGGISDFGEVLKTLDFGKITAVATGGILLLFVNQLTQMLKAMTSITNAASGFVTKFSKKLFGSQLKFKELAVSIGILAGSLYVLSQIKWDDLKYGLLGLAGAVLALVVAYGSFQAINVFATKKLNGIAMAVGSLNVVGMTAGILGLAAALKVIASIKSEDVDQAVNTLTSLMLFLMVYQSTYAMLSTIPGQGKLPASLIGMSAGLLGLIGVLKLLKSTELDDIEDGLRKLAEILLVMSGIQILFSVAARITGGNKLTTSMLGLAGGVLALLGVLKILSDIDLTEMSQGINNLFELGLILASLEVLFGWAAWLAGGNKLKSNILSMSIGIGAMIALIAILNSRPEGEFENGIDKLERMVGLVATIEIFTAAAARLAGGAKVQRILGAVALTLLSFTGVIAILGVMPKHMLDQGMAAIKQMVIMIGAIQFMTAMAARISGDASMFMPLIGISVAIIALTGSLALLSTMVDQEALRQASISLGIAAVAIGAMGVGIGIMTKGFSLMSENLKGLAGIKNVLLTGLLVLGAVLIGTVALLGTIKMVSAITRDMTWTDIAIFAAGMTAVTALIIAFSKLANTESGSWKTSLQSLVPGFAGAAAAIAATAGMFYAIQWVLPTIKDMNWDDVGKLVVGLGVVGLLIAAMALLGPSFQALGTGFVPAIGGVLTAIAGVGLVVAAFATLAWALDALFGSNDILEKGIEKLISIASGLGRFVGAILGGFNMEFLIQTGEGLAQFAESISRIKSVSFGDGVKGLGNAVDIAKDIKKFVKTLKDVDFSIVDPAMDALNRVNKTFAGFGGAALVSALESFNANQLPFQTTMLNFLNSTISTVSQKKDELVTVFSDLFRNAVRQSTGVIDDFKQLGANIVFGLRDGILSEKNNAIDAITGVAKSLEVATSESLRVDSPSKIFTDIGRWIPAGLGIGIKRNSEVASLAGMAMAMDVEEAVRNGLDIHSLGDTFPGIGKNVPAGLAYGVERNTKIAVAASGAMAQDVLDITDETLGQKAFRLGTEYLGGIGDGIEGGKGAALKLCEKLGFDLSDETINGFLTNLTNGESESTKKLGGILELLNLKTEAKEGGESLGVESGDGFVEGFDSTVGQGVRSSSAAASKDAFEIFKEDINKRKEFNVMSMDEEIRLWEEFAKKYAEGTLIRLKADKEIGRLKYENSKRWIDEEKYYKRLSLQDELAAWERVQARYKEGHEYRMQAEREIFRLKQELQNAAHQNSMNWIETERKYGRLNLMRELAAWTRVANNAEYSEEQRKNAEYEIFRVQKEISEKRKALEEDYYNKTKEIKDKLAQDIASLNKAYADAVESRAKTLYDSYRMFDAVEVKEPVDGEQLLRNLEDQVKAFDNWRKQITELGQRGIKEGLMDELEAMGPNSAAEIEALNSLTDEQLTQYVELWQQKHQSARSQAILELEGMRKDTDKQIKQLQNRSADQLSELKDTFNARMKEVSEVTVKWIQIMRGQVDQELRAMNIDIQGQLKQMVNGIQNMGSAVVNADNAAYKASRKKFAEDYKEEIAEMAKLHDVDLGVAQAILEHEMRKNGKAAIDGMKAGIKSESNSLVKTTVNTVKPVVTSVKNVLGIKSPSRVLFGLGKHSIGGFINGFGSMMTDVKEVGSQLAQATIESLTPVTSISSILDDMDIDPTITPVLDLTNIKRDSKEIGRLFGGQKVNLSSGAREKAKLFNRPLVPVTTSKENTPAVGTTISYTQNNYSPKALSRIEIYRQTRNQISTLKGLVTSSD